MTPSTFCFTRNNHFLCTERTGLMRKVYLVFITKGYIIGLVVNKGLLFNAANCFENATLAYNNLVLPNAKPYSCITGEYWDKIKDVYLFNEHIFKVDKYNFRIEISEITAFDYIIADNAFNKTSLHGLLFLSTYMEDLKVNNPQTEFLYNPSSKHAVTNNKAIQKSLHIIDNQTVNFDATYTAVRNWLLEQNVIGVK